MRKITFNEWIARGEELYGADRTQWEFRCVACGNVQSIQSVIKRNQSLSFDDIQDWIFFACECRYTKGVGCDWSLCGLFRIHQLEVITPDGEELVAFEFTDDPVGDWKPTRK